MALTDMPPSLFVAAFGGIFLILVLLRRRYNSLRDIPGPFAASFTKGWQIWHVIVGDTEKAVLKLHQKHGGFTFSSLTEYNGLCEAGHFVRLSHDEVSCSHPDAVRALLVAPLTKGDWYKGCAIPDKYHQTAMSEVDPVRKNEMKKIFAPGYLTTNVLRQEGHLDECLNGLQSHFSRLAAAHTPVNLGEWFVYWQFDAVAGLVFSGSFGFLDQAKDIGGSIANSKVFMVYLSITAHMYWVHDLLLANPLLKLIGFKPTQHILDTTERGVEMRRRNPEAGQDMIEQWGLAYRKMKKDGKTAIPDFKESDLVQNAASTITAGADTVAVALHSFIYHLHRYPTVKAKVVAEIDAAQAAGKLSPTIQASEALALPYLQAVLKETLRFFPPVPSAFPRKVPAGGLVIGGRRFEAGVTLSVNPHVIHQSTECFGPSAGEFVPERWLGGDEAKNRNLEKYFVTFGQGYNSCPGKQIAFIQLSKGAAMLMREFDFEPVVQGREWVYKNRFNVSPTGWEVYVRERKRGREG